MSQNHENNDLYETDWGRSLHVLRGLGGLAVGVALVGVSVAYYLARKAGRGVKNGVEFAVDAVVSTVEHDYEDSAAPVTIERIRKTG